MDWNNWLAQMCQRGPSVISIYLLTMFRHKLCIVVHYASLGGHYQYTPHQQTNKCIWVFKQTAPWIQLDGMLVLKKATKCTHSHRTAIWVTLFLTCVSLDSAKPLEPNGIFPQDRIWVVFLNDILSHMSNSPVASVSRRHNSSDDTDHHWHNNHLAQLCGSFCRNCLWIFFSPEILCRLAFYQCSQNEYTMHCPC